MPSRKYPPRKVDRQVSTGVNPYTLYPRLKQTETRARIVRWYKAGSTGKTIARRLRDHEVEGVFFSTHGEHNESSRAFHTLVRYVSQVLREEGATQPAHA